MPEDKGIETSHSQEEKNALRYTAGSVIKALKNKFKRSSNSPKKNSKYLNEINNKNDELSGGMKADSEDWLAVVGRSGLIHIGNIYDVWSVLSLWSLRMIFHSYHSFLLPIPE